MTFFAGDLATGLIRVRNIPASSGSTTAALGAAGTISCALRLPLRDLNTGVDIPFTSLIEPGKSFLAYEENGKIINAGPIWSDSTDLDTGEHTLNAAGLRSYFDYRFVIPALNDADPDDLPTLYSTTISGVHLRTIAKRLVEQSQLATGGNLPIVFESDVAGTATRTYPGYELHRVNEKLQQISEVENGPDIQFRPRFKSDRNFIEWQMLTGDPELTQGTNDHVWDMTVPVPAVRGVKIARSATVLATDNFQTGSQDENADVPLMAKSHDGTLLGDGYPRLESAVNRASVINVPVLQGYADDATLIGRLPLETWSFSANKNAQPTLDVYNEGDYCVLVTKDNPRVGTGRFRMRIMQYTVKLGDQFVDVRCAPERSRA